MAQINWKRLAVLAPSAAIMNMALLFLLFMNPFSQQIIFSESLGQNPKLVAVWTDMPPVPSLVSLLPALTITPVIYSVIFTVVYDSIPGKTGAKKGFAFGVMLWALIAVFFELLTPNGLFGEPLHLLTYELLLWFVGLILVGVAMGMIYKKQETVLVKST